MLKEFKKQAKKAMTEAYDYLSNLWDEEYAEYKKYDDDPYYECINADKKGDDIYGLALCEEQDNIRDFFAIPCLYDLDYDTEQAVIDKIYNKFLEKIR